jgi:hypothetical protein
MLLNSTYLRSFPKGFRAMTGLTATEFDEVVQDLLPRGERSEHHRLSRPNRKRDLGGGPSFQLSVTDQILLTIIWLRRYPTYEVLGFLFGISDTTAGRYIRRLLPLLERSGRDTMRLPDPGREHRRPLDALLKDMPELTAVAIDTFEQRVQRPLERAKADTYFSGKKKAHTLKSQVAVDLFTGKLVHVSKTVVGPTADLTLLRESGLLPRLPDEVARRFDLAYVGVGQDCPQAVCLLPRRKPRSKPRPAADEVLHTMMAKTRIVVEHRIGRMRWYESITHVDRHHRKYHTARVVSVAGFANRQIQHRLLEAGN